MGSWGWGARCAGWRRRPNFGCTPAFDSYLGYLSSSCGVFRSLGSWGWGRGPTDWSRRLWRRWQGSRCGAADARPAFRLSRASNLSCWRLVCLQTPFGHRWMRSCVATVWTAAVLRRLNPKPCQLLTPRLVHRHGTQRQSKQIRYSLDPPTIDSHRCGSWQQGGDTPPLSPAAAAFTPGAAAAPGSRAPAATSTGASLQI